MNRVPLGWVSGLAAGLLFGTVVVAVAEDITVTTYYPSPRGVYQTLRTMDQTTLAETGGNVGIGTTTPRAKLDIGVGLAARGPDTDLLIGNPTGNEPQLELYDTLESANILYADGDGLLFFINSARRMTIGTGGNVGIGTTNPNAVLDVKGVGTGEVLIGQWLAGNNYGAIGLANSLSQFDYNFLSSPGDKDLYINRPLGRTMRFRENNADQMTIATGGNVNVIGTITAASDARFKTDLQPLTNVLPRLSELHGVTYEPSKLAISLGRPSGHRDLGVVGQELEKVFPELVLKSGPEEYRSVDYSRLSVVLLEAVKELQKEQQRADKRIQELEEELKKVKR